MFVACSVHVSNVYFDDCMNPYLKDRFENTFVRILLFTFFVAKLIQFQWSAIGARPTGRHTIIPLRNICPLIVNISLFIYCTSVLLV